MLKYVGDGAAIIGIPARDLSDKDIEKLEKNGWSVQQILDTKLYEDEGSAKFNRKHKE